MQIRLAVITLENPAHHSRLSLSHLICVADSAASDSRRRGTRERAALPDSLNLQARRRAAVVERKNPINLFSGPLAAGRIAQGHCGKSFASGSAQQSWQSCVLSFRDPRGDPIPHLVLGQELETQAYL